MKALIDGDILVYRCAHAAQHNTWLCSRKDDPSGTPQASFRYKKEAVEWVAATTEGKDGWTVEKDIEPVVEPVANCLHSIKHLVGQILSDTKADDYVIYLGGEGNFRLQVDSNYKANRKDKPKPVHLQAAIDYVLANYNAEVVSGMEADDALGIEQCRETEDNTIICTIDKDLDQIPGRHYNPTKQESYYVDELNADLYIQMQLLTGDSVDNIPGITGIGEKTAYKMLDACATKEEEDTLIQARYQQEFPDNWGVRLGQNKQLITILRAPNE